MDFRWNPGIPINEGEDKEFSQRLKKAGKKIISWPSAVAVHDDPRLTQQGNIVVNDKGNDQSAQQATERRPILDRGVSG